MTFKVGDKVKWVSSNTDKIGEVVAIVPEGRRPADVGYPRAGGGGFSRGHTSFIVKGKKVDARGNLYGPNALYWPVVSLLQAVE